MASEDVLDVVIAGAGVAGMEALLALRELMGDKVRLTLVDPRTEFVDRPRSVGEAFLVSTARRYPLADVATEAGARLVTDTVVAVTAPSHELRLRSRGSLPYDRLVLALGTRRERVHEHAVTFGNDAGSEAMRRMLDDARRGRIERVAFVVPPGAAWLVPLYELAVMTATELHSAGVDGVDIVLVTPEQRPLAVFGRDASVVVAELLARAGVAFIGAAQTRVDPGAILIRPGDRRLAAGCVVTVPRLRGPGIDGVKDYADGYVATDDYGRVPGVPGIYAAGDMTTFPLKHGGLAAQQAETVATTIAAEAGVAVEPRPFRPVLRAMLLAGPSECHFIRYGGRCAEVESEVAESPLWWPPTKAGGGHLARYLWDREQVAVA